MMRVCDVHACDARHTHAMRAMLMRVHEHSGCGTPPPCATTMMADFNCHVAVMVKDAWQILVSVLGLNPALLLSWIRACSVPLPALGLAPMAAAMPCFLHHAAFSLPVVTPIPLLTHRQHSGSWPANCTDVPWQHVVVHGPRAPPQALHPLLPLHPPEMKSMKYSKMRGQSKGRGTSSSFTSPYVPSTSTSSTGKKGGNKGNKAAQPC